ncbi:MAG: branched-chain amino acid transaminase [candidate division KSB1 bacterium]|nr:branched-chain amino acid transaminase [candidate division KSB1 bacterium]MDZ7339690.1 branched-chain amino acid transaminase [candidate division KSB1 bacterium]MDZ7385765.1 branched-chain amino acid transaminase [candidate division KSB1 bacterium]MDZ7391356.1 branched-chain amino acid transaminase [candidate division KSB1 bacterium]MDZ7413842.1 branched-chain amino acid transaminase [candidate division KSB1 bacterium]
MDPRDEKGKIWFSGKFVDWKDATVHVMSHALHYGSSVFEGLRCYKTPAGPAIFRLQDHTKRLFNSAKICRMEIPFTQEQINQACIDVIRVNGLESAYLRPIVFRGYGQLGVDPRGCPIEVVIGALNWGKYLGEEAINVGVDVQVSSWGRMAPNTLPALAKAGANYLNSQLIKLEAVGNGFVEGIALDVNGYVSEGSGENIFLVRDGVLYTPPLSASILPGISRDSVMVFAREMGIEVREMMIPREMLYVADEVFFTGSAAEISPIKSIDRVPIGSGKRGPITARLQERFFAYVNGQCEDCYGWRTIVQ